MAQPVRLGLGAVAAERLEGLKRGERFFEGHAARARRPLLATWDGHLAWRPGGADLNAACEPAGSPPILDKALITVGQHHRVHLAGARATRHQGDMVDALSLGL
jgi:hypothetical protein